MRDRMMVPVVLLAGWVFLLVGPEGLTGEAPATPEQIAAWVKQLGADDFEAREKAEEALIKAGTAALPELKKAAQSIDLEIRTRSARVAEKIKWAVLPNVTDLATILPADNIFFIGAPSARELVTRIRKDTALGRLYDQPEMSSLRDALYEMSVAGAGLDDDGRKMVDQWFDRFGGPLGVAYIRYDPKQESYINREQIGFFVGINDPNPDAAMGAFCKYFPLRGNPVAQLYRGVNCSFLQEEWRGEGLARLTNLIVRSNGKPSMFNIIDAVMDDKPPDLAGAEVYKEARAKISGEPLGMLFFNMQSMFGAIFDRERDRAAATGLGFQAWKYAIVTLGVKDGLFLEQAYCKVEGERHGLAKLFSLEPVSGRLAALCPPDALLFASIPTDGAAIYEAIMTMVEQVDPRDAKQFKDQMVELDQKLNVKVMDSLVGGLKGEAAVWLLRPQGPDLTKMPETCMAIEAVDAAAATKAADTLAKLLPLVAGKEDFVGKAEYQGRTCYFMQPAEKQNPWEPDLFWSWCADGARVLIGQRQDVLQRMVLHATKDVKGLDARPDFQKLLAAIPQDERGGLAYANTSEVLTWAYTVGLPALSAEAPEDLKAKLAQAPKDPKALFKDFPGTLLSVRGTPDGVRARAVGGAPATGWTMTVPFAFFYTMRVAMQREMLKQQAEAVRLQKAAAEEEAKAEKEEPAEKAEPQKVPPPKKKAEEKE
jgi:hypothetical protein